MLIWGAFLFAAGAAAQPDEISPAETEIKAAFLYKFTGYVQWPESSFEEPGSTITIGIVGAEEITEELRRIVSGRTVQGRGLAVTRVSGESDLNHVHVLFMGREAITKVPRLLAAARQRPILIVSDAPDGLDRGSMINFVIVKRRVQFEIAIEAAQKAGLALSSRLLSVALRVKKGNIEHELYLAWQAPIHHRSRRVHVSMYATIPARLREKTGVVSLV